jgi:hypothetical protein
MFGAWPAQNITVLKVLFSKFFASKLNVLSIMRLDSICRKDKGKFV